MDSEKIKIIRDYKKMNQTAFAVELNMTQAYLSEVENGKKAISKSLLQNIAIKYPEINIRWILIGEGEMTGDSLKLESNNIQQIGNGNKHVIQTTSKDELYERLLSEKDRYIKTLEKQLSEYEKK